MRRLPPLGALRAFESAARHLSFRRAAEELAVTPTAISHQVKLLEEITGQELFRRRPRPLQLTAAGEVLFPPLRDGFDSFVVGLRRLSEGATERPLRVSMTSAFASRWLLPRVDEWQALHPTPRIDILSGETLVDLHSGDVDFVIRYSRLPPAGLKATMLFRDTYSPVASPSFLHALSKLTSPQDLSGARLIAFDWRSGDPDAPSWERWLAEALLPGIAPSTILDQCQWLRVTEETQAIELALAGKGLALVSNILVAREMNAGTLKAPFDVRLEGFGFWVTSLPACPRTGLIEAFAAWARAAA